MTTRTRSRSRESLAFSVIMMGLALLFMYWDAPRDAVAEWFSKKTQEDIRDMQEPPNP